MPLLAEVFEAFGQLVNVELKCDAADDRGLTAEVVRTIRAAGAGERVLLSSFNPLCLLRARALAPGIPRAMLFEREQRWVLRSGLAAPLLGAAALHPEQVLATISALSMILGNLAALTQDNVKRMLGYSSIAHAGYVLLGIMWIPSIIVLVLTLAVWYKPNP